MPDERKLIDELKEILWDAAYIEPKDRTIRKRLDFALSPEVAAQSLAFGAGFFLMKFVAGELLKRLLKTPLDDAADAIQERISWLFENRRMLTHDEEIGSFEWILDQLKDISSSVEDPASLLDGKLEVGLRDYLMEAGYSVDAAVARAKLIMEAFRKHLG